MLAVQLTGDKLVNVWKIIRYQNPTKLLQDIFAATLTELIWSHAAPCFHGKHVLNFEDQL